jgi:hypothetical protein
LLGGAVSSRAVPNGINVKIKSEGDGQECLSHTIEGQGLKPAWIVRLYAALKRRSSTLLLAPLAIDPSKSQGLKPASLLALGGAA